MSSTIQPAAGTGQAKFNKPNEILVMVPIAGRITAIGRKLYNVMLQRSQLQLQKMKRIPDATEYFEAPLAELLSDVGESDIRTTAKKYLTEMQEVTIEWDSPESTAGSEWKRLKLISEVELTKRNGVNWVRWALPPTMVEAIADPSRWTPLVLAILAKLTTYASVALYEICVRYKSNPSGLTTRRAVDWWIDALTGTTASLDKAGKKKRREWRKFKHEFVLSAIKEINANTDIEISILESKRGKAVAEVQFSIRKKLAVVNSPTYDQPVDTTILRRALKAGISEREMDHLIAERSEADFAEALTKLEQRMAMDGLEPVRSALGYMRHLLGKKDPGSPAVQEPVPIAPQIAPPASIPTSSWLDTRRQEIAAELSALPAEAQARLLQQVAASLRERNMLPPSLARRAAQGDWAASGVLKSEMVRVYGQQTFGPAWDKEPEVIDEEPVEPGRGWPTLAPG